MNSPISLPFRLFLSPRSPKVWEAAKQYVNTERIRDKPLGFIEPSKELVEECDEQIKSKRGLILTGPTGSGKTTLAAAIGRRLLEMNGKSPVQQVPIWVPFSQDGRTNGVVSFLHKLAERSVDARLGRARSWFVSQMIRNGRLMLILDDLEYLSKRDHLALERFIEQWRSNTFLCLIPEQPPYGFARLFDTIPLPGWSGAEAKAYIARLIADEAKRTELTRHLEELGTFDRTRTPYEWESIVSAGLDGTIFESIFPKGLEHADDYRILNNYFSIVIKNRLLEKSNEVIRKVCKLSLKLIKKGRSSFTVSEAEIDLENLKKLTPNLFHDEGDTDTFSFAHNNAQVLLAGKYLGEYWSEAKEELDDTDAEKLIWTAAYNCALQFASSEEVLVGLRKAFRAKAGEVKDFFRPVRENSLQEIDQQRSDILLCPVSEKSLLGEKGSPPRQWNERVRDYIGRWLFRLSNRWRRQWNERVKDYIGSRIDDGNERGVLVKHLEELGAFETFRAQDEWERIISIYFENHIFECVFPRGWGRTDDYLTLGAYFRIIITDSFPKKSDEVIRSLGQLALKLLKLGRSSFTASEAEISDADLEKLTPKLFQKAGDTLSFAHEHAQVLLAGKYLGEYWSEAKDELRDSDAEKLIWRSVYNCAIGFISFDKKGKLRRVFEIKARNWRYRFRPEELNTRAFEAEVEELTRRYAGSFVAYVNGERFAINENAHELTDLLMREHRGKPTLMEFLRKPGTAKPVLRIETPEIRKEA